MEQKKVLGIVLSASPISEFDKRVVILTKEMGKVSAFAKNSRKINNTLSASTIPLTYGEFIILEGRNSNNIISASGQNHFPKLHEDLEKACYGMYFLELADYFTREYNDEREMLKLLYQSLRALESGKFDIKLVRAVFEWRTLVINGLYPDITDIEFIRKYKLSESAVYTLQFVSSIIIEKLYTFNLNEKTLSELVNVTASELKKHVDRPMKSLETMKDLI